jgi:hypothetical protein
LKKETFKIQKYPPIEAWSFSRWETYETCPFKACCKFVLKLPEESGPAADRGTAIHKLAEDYLLGRIPRQPKELAKLKPVYAAMKKEKPEAEVEFAMTREWEPTGWFARGEKAAWCRVKIDALTPPTVAKPIVFIRDHKTGGLDKNGKFKTEKVEQAEPQLELYGIAGFKRHPIAKEVKTQLLFVDAGIATLEKTYLLKELPVLIARWAKRVVKMLSDTAYAPRPGDYCRYCTYAKSKGGPCVY